MGLTFTERVREVLADSGNADFMTTTYLPRLWAVRSEASAAFDKSMSRALALAATFVVIVEAGASKVTFAGMEVSKISVVEQSLPVLVLYYWVRALEALITIELVTDAERETVRQVAPAVHERALDRLMHMPIAGDFERIAAPGASHLIAAVNLTQNILYQFTYLCLPAVFQIYAFARLYPKRTHAPVLWLVAMGVFMWRSAYLAYIPLRAVSRPFQRRWRRAPSR